ncbi:MAG: rhomboid family intramembrane serine protease [Promethearchaeota archaeon]|nr:MAG: rhomboid family intramembrane serine protease [Candidatus Lokiarchaeota archaeon]
MMVLDIENLKEARITLILVFVNVMIFFLFNVAIPIEILLLFVQINRNIFENYEIWRLFTAMFFHGDPIHLISNMLALLLFGATIETNKNITHLQYLIIYFSSGLIGNLFSLILLPIDSISLGASGAVFGLIGVAFIMVVTDYQPLLFLALFYIAYFILTSFTPGINYWAHLFGLLGGLLFGYLFYRRKRKISSVY